MFVFVLCSWNPRRKAVTSFILIIHLCSEVSVTTGHPRWFTNLTERYGWRCHRGADNSGTLKLSLRNGAHVRVFWLILADEIGHIVHQYYHTVRQS